MEAAGNQTVFNGMILGGVTDRRFSTLGFRHPPRGVVARMNRFHRIIGF